MAAIAKPARTNFVLPCQSICTLGRLETRSGYNLIGEAVQSLYGLLFEQSRPSIPVAIDCTGYRLVCSSDSCPAKGASRCLAAGLRARAALATGVVSHATQSNSWLQRQGGSAASKRALAPEGYELGEVTVVAPL